MTATMTTELTTACEDYLAAYRKEKCLVDREQQLLHQYGEAHLREVQMAHALPRLQSGLGENLDDGVADAIEAWSQQQKESERQRTTCAALCAALETVRKYRRQAADETARTFAQLCKQSRLDLSNRWGKTSARFGFWTEAREQEFVWRSHLLRLLLAKVQSGRSEDGELLGLFFTGAGFQLKVMHGFYVRTDAGMKEIRPGDGQQLHVPADISFDLAFELLASGRAEICA